MARAELLARTARAALGAALVAALALPWLLQALGAGYYLGVASRIIVWGIAATSLNLVLGYGGMVSLGHAAFMGLGGYATAVLVTEGITHGGLHLLATLAVTSLAALVIGAISLRTRGVYFIMITLAFAQMLFYLSNSLKGYGGDEGLTIRARAIFFGFDLKNGIVLYYTALALLAATLVALARFVPSRLGRAVLAARDDELRAEALGFATYRDKLVIFVAAAAVAGVAGALNANLQGYVSPNSLHWTQSGTLLVMVILGGVGTVGGALVGAAALLLIEETLSAYTPYWQFWTGWLLLAVVLFARGGIAGLAVQAWKKVRR